MQNKNQALLDQLQSGISRLGLQVSDENRQKMLKYTDILLKWNKVYNLTASVGPEEILIRHILDSLSIVPFLHGNTVLDIGSGAGLPGIPCALALPETCFILLDSNGKKTRFLTQVIAELKITNTKIIQTRLEDYQLASCVDCITARAFSALENIIRLTKHLLCPDGELVLMKGAYPEAELQKISNHAKVHKISVPFLHEQRHLVIIKGPLNE